MYKHGCQVRVLVVGPRLRREDVGTFRALKKETQNHGIGYNVAGIKMHSALNLLIFL